MLLSLSIIVASADACNPPSPLRVLHVFMTSFYPAASLVVPLYFNYNIRRYTRGYIYRNPEYVSRLFREQSFVCGRCARTGFWERRFSRDVEFQMRPRDLAPVAHHHRKKFD